MRDNDLTLLTQKLAELGEHFGAELSKARLLSYLECLCDLSPERVLTAIRVTKLTCKFFPTVAELRELAGGATVTTEERAELAWANLRRLTGSKAYNPLALTDPIARDCFEVLGGAEAFGVWDYEKQEDFKKRRFVELYKAKAKAAGTMAHPPLNRVEAEETLQGLVKATQKDGVPRIEGKA